MKKLLSALILSGFCLLTSIKANALPSMKGENLCETILKVLESNGYSKNSALTADSIKEMLKNSNITMSDDVTLVQNQRYSMNYSCEATHGVAHAELIATPTDNNIEARIAQIKWTATKPVSR